MFSENTSVITKSTQRAYAYYPLKIMAFGLQLIYHKKNLIHYCFSNTHLFM